MEILLENYCKTLNIEVLTLADIIRKDILPSVLDFSKSLSQGVFYQTWSFVGSCKTEKTLLRQVSKLSNQLYNELESLQITNSAAQEITDIQARAQYYKINILSNMERVRALIDTLEEIVPTKYWNLPTYSDLLFKV